MHDGFIRAIQADPTNDAARLVYADWLEEQGDPVSAAQAEFLRVTVKLAATTGTRGWKKRLRTRLQELARDLEPEWLAVVSRLPIENCQGKRAKARSASPVRFDYLCDRRWEDLRPTDDPAVRRCDGCRQNVHYCDTINDARQHAWAGRCIAVDLGVIRRERDLEPRRMMLGRASVEMMDRERERMEPDPVSAERERRKRGAGGRERSS